MFEIRINNSLKLEEINVKHTEAIFELVNNNRLDFRKWLAFVDDTKFINDTENYIHFINLNRYEKNGEFVFSIIYDGKVAGCIGLKKNDYANHICEIGYWIDPQLQGRGIISESCKRLIAFAFIKENANRIEIKCGTGNEKSCHIAERLGFTLEGIEREGELVNGEYIDLKVYSLLKKEWELKGKTDLPPGLLDKSGIESLKDSFIE
jgi:ribosomal-protein-serine acetyltransferase